MKKTIELFKRAYQKNKLSHLYLLSGENGSPLLDTAINCCVGVISGFNDNGDVYKKVIHHNHPDFYLLDKGINKILKEDITYLQEEFTKTSAVDGYRCFVINNIDNITTQAANSMLKFLEEPSLDKVLGILLTNNKDYVLPTILSRLQSVIVSNISFTEFSEKTSQLKIFNSQEIFYISLFTKDISKVEMYASDGDFKVFLSLLHKFISDYLLLKNDFFTTSFFELKAFLKNKDLVYFFYEALFNFFLMVLKSNKEDKTIGEEIINKVKQFFDKEQILCIIKACNNILKKVTYNVNAELQLLQFLVLIDKVIKYDFM